MSARKLKLDELGRISPEEFRESEKVPVTIVLDNIRSMHNVGAVFRTADAFRISKICLCGFTPQPPHRDIRKVAIGAEETVVWQYYESVSDALKELRSAQVRVISIEQTTESKDLSSFEPNLNSAYAIVLGNEVEGVSDEAVALSDECLEIPQFGTKHSLNVSVCAGIVMWEFASHWLIPVSEKH